MTSIGKALLFGVVVWLVPFVVAFLIFPLRESSRALFESIMPVAVAGATVVLGVVYMARVSQGVVRDGEYLADIGVTYLMIPVITTGLGLVRARALTAERPRRPTEPSR
jgi:hypothetical protein